MKALYKSGRGVENVSLQDRPVPELNEVDNVRVKVHACAICGMDNGIYHDRFPCKPPFIMGHEFVGTVEKIGADVERVAVGDRVVCQPHLYSCGKCDACRMDLPQLCRHKRSIGIERDGAMAEYVVVPQQYLHKLPESIPDSLACLLEPFSIVMGNLGIPVEQEKARNVVIIGAGQVGQLGIIAAKACGAEQVILSGVHRDHEFRFAVAKKLGADVVMDNAEEDVAQRVLELTDGIGADIVLEASGSETGIHSAFHMVKNGGLISVMGGTKRDSVSVNWDVCLRKAARVHFHMMSDYRYMSRAIEIFANPYTDLSPIVTGEYSLENWQQAFADIAAKKSIKNVLYL